jgi:hypothetical protein
MKYTIFFIKKNGKVKGKVGCNTLDTVYYLVDTWQVDPDKKGICLVVDNETKSEWTYTK